MPYYNTLMNYIEALRAHSRYTSHRMVSEDSYHTIRYSCEECKKGGSQDFTFSCPAFLLFDEGHRPELDSLKKLFSEPGRPTLNLCLALEAGEISLEEALPLLYPSRFERLGS